MISHKLNHLFTYGVWKFGLPYWTSQIKEYMPLLWIDDMLFLCAGEERKAVLQTSHW